MDHYLHILSLLLRLRQACDQPMLVALSTMERESQSAPLQQQRRQRGQGNRRFSYYEVGKKLQTAYSLADGIAQLLLALPAPPHN